MAESDFKFSDTVQNPSRGVPTTRQIADQLGAPFGMVRSAALVVIVQFIIGDKQLTNAELKIGELYIA